MSHPWAGWRLAATDGKGRTFREQASGLVYALMAGFAAMLTGSLLAAHGLQYCGIPIVAAAAALLGSLSRPMVRATTQYILFTIIAANLGRGSSHHTGAVAIVFLMGGVWTAGLSLGFRPLFQAIAKPPAADAASPPRYTLHQYLRRWKRSLTRLKGWQYTLRITLCLAAAEALELFWPGHRGYWIAVTVVIVAHRNLQEAVPRTIHRATGTAIGVLLISLFMLWASSAWGVVILIAVLAALRPMLLETSYLAYAAVQTALVILLLEFGQEVSWMVLIERMAATLAGCALALTLGYVGWSRWEAV